MTRCPFCQYDNEDGAVFCEQCKSDLGVLETNVEVPVPAAAMAEEMPETTAKDTPVPERIIPVASPVVVTDAPVVAGSFPVATPVDPSPSAARGQEALKAATSTSSPMSADSEIDSSPTSPFLGAVGDTFDSVKTFVPPSDGSKSREEESAEGANAPFSDQEAQTTPHSTRDTDVLPTSGNPVLLVLRGQRINVEYPIYEGDNFIGRTDEKPVDIDLEDQEPPDRIWSSRQHALLRYQEGVLTVEDLNSSNGTFINRTRLYPGQKRVLNVNDIIQIGTVQMKVVLKA